LRLETGVHYVRRAPELARDDPQPCSRRLKIRPARALDGLEGIDDAQKLAVACRENPLPVLCFAVRRGVHDHVAAAIDADRRPRLLAPQPEVELVELCTRTSHRGHRGARDSDAAGRGLRLPEPIDDPQAHEVRVGPQLDLLGADTRHEYPLT